MLPEECDRLSPICRLPDHFHIGLPRQNGGNPLPEDRVVVDGQDPDTPGGAHGLSPSLRAEIICLHVPVIAVDRTAFILRSASRDGVLRAYHDRGSDAAPAAG